MSQNLVSITITKEQQERVLAAIQVIYENLPGLITLDPGERRRLSMMGPKSEQYARTVLQALVQNQGVVPSNVDVAGGVSDMTASDMLFPIQLALQQLSARVDDTRAALGSDVMALAHTGSGMLKILGNDHGLEDLRKELSARWARPSKKSSPKSQE